MFGADIEFFVTDPQNGKPMAACGKVGGKKDDPIKIDDTFSILEDGAAVELNYKPTNDVYAWTNNMVLSAEVIKKHTKFGVWGEPEAKIPNLNKYPQAMEIGCMPDFDAYSDNPEVAREIPDIKEFGMHRFAGGHIHLSYDINKKIPAYAVARLIDYYLTIPILADVSHNLGQVVAKKLLGLKRAKFYGLAGLHRPKEYGIEYRTFSNYFAINQRVTQYFPHRLDNLQYLLRQDKLDYLNNKYMEINWEEIQDCINNMKFDKCREITNAMVIP